MANCRHCSGEFTGEDHGFLVYRGERYDLHYACAGAFVKILVPDVFPQTDAQLTREKMLQAIHRTGPPEHINFKHT